MSETLRIFNHPVKLEAIKIHTNAIGESFVVTLIASLDDESIIWAGTAARAQDSGADVTPVINELFERFRLWMTEVAS